MADNILLNLGAGGETVATDDIGGIQHELVKIEWGSDGIATMVDESNPLPVEDSAAITALVSILAKIIASPATEATEASILAALNAGIAVTGTFFQATQPVSDANVAKGFGAWSYESATLISGNLSATGRCVGIRIFANGVDGSFNINGGDTINVRNGAGVDVNTGGNLVNPVVNWVSGSIDVLIETVT